MAYKDEKIVEVLLDEASRVDNRCEGYSDELTTAIADIIQVERSHVFRRTNVVSEITDIIERVGKFVEMMEKSK